MIYGSYDNGWLRTPEPEPDEEEPDVFDRADFAYEREREQALLDEHLEQIEMERRHPVQ